MNRVPVVMSTSWDHPGRLERLSTKKCRASSSPALARATSTLYTHREAAEGERSKDVLCTVTFLRHSRTSIIKGTLHSVLCTLTHKTRSPVLSVLDLTAITAHPDNQTLSVASTFRCSYPARPVLDNRDHHHSSYYGHSNRQDHRSL